MTHVSSSGDSQVEEQRTAVLRAAEDLAANCLRGALPPVDLRAVCLVRAFENVVVVVGGGGG